MEKILADTNFLLAQFEYRLDIISELRRVIPGPATLLVGSGTLRELEALAGRHGRRAAAARFALQSMPHLKKAFGVEIVPGSGAVDAWIIKYARENRVCVATNDVPLRRRLAASGVRTIAVKGKSKLEFV